MNEPEIRKADVSTKLELPMYDAIAAGFPITSDYPADRLDFNRDSIKHDFRSPSYTTKWSDIPEAE